MEQQGKRNIAILGSTGSIGEQALEVINENPDFFCISVLTANQNAQTLIEQAQQYQPNTVVIGDDTKFEQVRDALFPAGIKVFAGAESLEQIMTLDEIDMLLTGVVGFSGLKPTIKAIEAGKDIALANKETLVVAGELITSKAKEHNVSIIPVDSEHSAIFQCLAGETVNPVEKIYLTASGGPFRGKSYEELKHVSKNQALKHPNWDMGAKITIDSASLMNKGLEVIEAKWLFALDNHQIDVIIHPQSIIHSIVQFEDGAMKAEMGLADMRIPIQYALTYPYRLPNRFPRFNFLDYSELTFEQPDQTTFKNLELAFEALKSEGNKACILNAANEIAVDAFLNDDITFTEIFSMNEQCMDKIDFIQHPTLEDYLDTDQQTRTYAKTLIK